MADEQPNYEPTAQPEKPQEGSSWVMLLVAVLVAIIAGGGVWAYYQYKVLPDLENQSNASNVNLNINKNNTNNAKNNANNNANNTSNNNAANND